MVLFRVYLGLFFALLAAGGYVFHGHEMWLWADLACMGYVLGVLYGASAALRQISSSKGVG
jgi:hypothetical protein